MHTPGPWETSVLSDGTQWEVCAAGGGDFIAATEKAHDARLIAKAPAMLDVLRRVADFWAGGDVPAELDRDIRALLED